MIKLPSLQTVDVSTHDPISLKKGLIDAHLGENPVALVFSASTTKSATENVIKKLKDICQKLSVNPKLPYPLFIVTGHDIQSDDFPIVKSKDDITKYYKLKLTKLKKRESNLLNKVKTYTTRINHYGIDESIHIIKKHSIKHNALKSTCKENAFYTEIINTIEEAQKKQE